LYEALSTWAYLVPAGHLDRQVFGIQHAEKEEQFQGEG
jgi:hypothetical protein